MNLKLPRYTLPFIALLSIYWLTIISVSGVVQGRHRSSYRYSNSDGVWPSSPTRKGADHYDEIENDDGHSYHDEDDYHHESDEGAEGRRRLSNICLKDDIYETSLPPPRIYVHNLTAGSEARENFRRMLPHACKTPRPVVLRVQIFYPNVTLSYIPRSVVLHRCEQSGCCSSEETTCKPVSTETVWASYYVVGKDTNKWVQSHVQQLAFINHTRCSCQQIVNMPREQEQYKLEHHHRHHHNKHHSKHHHKHHHHHKHESESDPLKADRKPAYESTLDEVQVHGPLTSSSSLSPSSVTLATLDASNAQSDDQGMKNGRSHLCRWVECPLPFSVRESTRDLSNPCSCDCFPDDRDCLLIKRGKEALQKQEKYCVQRKMCLEPQCESGFYYDQTNGRCIPFHVKQASPISYSENHGLGYADYLSNRDKKSQRTPKSHFYEPNHGQHQSYQSLFYDRRRGDELYERD